MDTNTKPPTPALLEAAEAVVCWLEKRALYSEPLHELIAAIRQAKEG